MANCKSCGMEIGDAKFCPACGIAQDSIVETAAPVYETSSQSFEPLTGAPVSGDTRGQSTVQTANTVPYYSAPDSSAIPNHSGQMIFAIVNIVLGALLCCCGGFVTLVLGIIAAVLNSKVDSAATVEEAKKKISTIRILNIIAVICLVVFFFLTLIIWLANGAQSYSHYYNYSTTY